MIFFLLPIFVFRIMRRGTESYNRLGEIRDLLRKQAALSIQPGIAGNPPELVQPSSGVGGMLNLPRASEALQPEPVTIQTNAWWSW